MKKSLLLALMLSTTTMLPMEMPSNRALFAVGGGIATTYALSCAPAVCRSIKRSWQSIKNATFKCAKIGASVAVFSAGFYMAYPHIMEG